jgi:hypothetical protein
MRSLALSLTIVLALTGNAAAQAAYEGNWICMKDDKQAGLLTIYGNGYGYASNTFGDQSSGTGTVQGYSDGVQFKDGPFVSVLGLEAGRLLAGEGAISLTLERPDAILMICTPMVTGVM